MIDLLIVENAGATYRTVRHGDLASLIYARLGSDSGEIESMGRSGHSVWKGPRRCVGILLGVFNLAKYAYITIHILLG
jgi:hypothetical protein